MKRASRIKMLIFAMLTLAAINAIGKILFNLPVMSATQFILVAFIAAWCGDVPDAQPSEGGRKS